MSPERSCDINGPRPSPLLINKTSRTVHKPKSSSSSYVSGAGAVHPQVRKPVIIYTHSPKVIHTQPKDFMALVQRLTGFTRSSAGEGTLRKENSDVGKFAAGNENDSCSVLTEENSGAGDARPPPSYRSPVARTMEGETFMTDIPLFTPRSTDLFLSPSNLSSSMSPSFMEFLKGFPEF